MLSRTVNCDATLVQVNNGAVRIKSLKVEQYSGNAPALYLQVFNSYTPTVGVTAPDMVVRIGTKPAAQDKTQVKVVLPSCGGSQNGARFGTGLSYAVTTTPTGSTSPNAGDKPTVEVNYENANL